MKIAAMKTAAWFVAVLFISSGALAQELPKPGPEHEAMKQLAGNWEGDMKCHFVPDAPATSSKCKYTAKVGVGGFFLLGEIDSEIDGMPFQGRAITGYDAAQKKYTGVWVDSMSPAIFNTAGEFDKTGKVYNETMEGPGPDGKPMKFRSECKLKDKDSMQYTLYGPGTDGKETLMMEIDYKRAK